MLNSKKVELSVGELAKRSGVAVSTLHFYEKKGLIFAQRTDGNQRRYPRETLRLVAIIKAAQLLGISLAEIKAALAGLPKAPEGKQPRHWARDWQKVATTWGAQLDERIARLTKLRDTLDGCIGCGCLSVTACPLRNPEDKFGQTRSGSWLTPSRSHGPR